MKTEALLDKYWEGETTLEEERLLKAYFEREAAVQESLRYAIPYFRALRAEQAVVMRGTPVPLRKTSSFSIRASRAAAAVLLGVLSWAGMRAWQAQQATQHALLTQEKLYEDTYTNPEEAAREIKAALALVSSKMNKGKRKAQQGLRQMEKVEKYIPKAPQ